MDFTLSEELTMVRDMAREFVTNELLPIEREVLVREKGGTRGAPIPADKRARLKKMAIDQGLWAMTAPEAVGGGGLGTLGACLVDEELGKTFVDFDFGEVPPVLFEANATAREAYLKPVVTGNMECSLALREPDLEGVSFAARAVPDGEGWRLNGRKSAASADLFLVYAGTDQGPTCFVVERDWPGVVAQAGGLRLVDVQVPPANVVGEVGAALSLDRPYRNARMTRDGARKIGIAARLLEMAAQYARDWKALGQPLAVRPSVQRDLAEMAVEVDAARWLILSAACAVDEGKDARQAALRAHLYASETVRRAIDRTIRVYGGPAYTPDLPMLHAYRDDLAVGVGERALAAQRYLIAENLTA